MNQKELNPIALALGLTGALACSSAVAADNPFSLTELSGQTYAGSHGGEGKCGEGKCGEDKDAGEGKKKEKCEGRCGEGKCGEGKCGEDKDASEGKCGEGKCGGDAGEGE